MKIIGNLSIGNLMESGASYAKIKLEVNSSGLCIYSGSELMLTIYLSEKEKRILAKELLK